MSYVQRRKWEINWTKRKEENEKQERNKILVYFNEVRKMMAKSFVLFQNDMRRICCAMLFGGGGWFLSGSESPEGGPLQPSLWYNENPHWVWLPCGQIPAPMSETFLFFLIHELRHFLTSKEHKTLENAQPHKSTFLRTKNLEKTQLCTKKRNHWKNDALVMCPTGSV